MGFHEKTTIILVEDDQACSILVRRFFKRYGIENQVIHFATGGGFLTFLNVDLQNKDMDNYLVILDLDLPDTTGFELLSKVKEKTKKANSTLKTVIHTTSDNADDILRCRQLGADAYCVKSFHVFPLADVLLKMQTVLEAV